VRLLREEIKEKPTTCLRCQHATVKKFGSYDKRRIPRYRCQNCSATFSGPRPKPLGTHYISLERATQVVSRVAHTFGKMVCLRATVNGTGVARACRATHELLSARRDHAAMSALLAGLVGCY
jgi:hypothetical protein